MYTIFFIINCVEQLSFFKSFVNQLQFKQSLIFCLKVKLLKINFDYTHGRWFSIFEQLSLFDKLLDMCCPAVVFVLTTFFELSQFEQLNIEHWIFWFTIQQNITIAIYLWSEWRRNSYLSDSDSHTFHQNSLSIHSKNLRINCIRMIKNIIVYFAEDQTKFLNGGQEIKFESIKSFLSGDWKYFWLGDWKYRRNHI